MVFSINPTAEKTQVDFQALAIKQKGQGSGSAITGNGTSSAPAGQESQPAATSVASGGSSPSETGSASSPIQTGTGTLESGACVCAVTCGAGSFPAVNAQGIGNFGGFPGM
jgi:hypothetical protein